MQINRAELQKVRVKLSRDALTIQKEGGGSTIPALLQANQPEVSSNIFLLDAFLWIGSHFSVRMFTLRCYVLSLIMSSGSSLRNLFSGGVILL